MWIDFLFGYLASNVRILLTSFDVAQTCSYMFITCSYYGCCLMNSYEVWTFDLLPIAIGLYAMSMLFHVDCMFLLPCLATNVDIFDDVFECSFLKYTAESEESRYCNGIQILWTEVCSRDLGLNWLNSLIWKRTFEPNSMKQHHIFVYLGLRWFSRPQYVSHFFSFSTRFRCHGVVPSWQFWSYEVVRGVHHDQSDLGFTPLCRSLSVEPWRAVISDDSRTLPENM